MSESMSGLPDTFFLVLHESGIIIYTYPDLGKEQYLISSLISATMALGDRVSGREGEIASVKIGDRTILAVKEKDIIYSLITTKKIVGAEKLLFSLVEETKKNFPVEIVDGVVRSKMDTAMLDTRISSLILLHIRVTEVARGEERREIHIPLPDAYKIIGAKRFVKILRLLIAGKNIIIAGYDPISIAKVLFIINNLYPRPIQILTMDEEGINKLSSLGAQSIIIVRRGLEEKLASKLENYSILDFDKPLGKIKRDKLYEALDRILALGSEESRILAIKNELMSLVSIIEDMESILEKEERKLTLEELKKRLSKRHPADKVDYILRVLQDEKSRLLKQIKTPEKVLEEIFF